MGGEGPVRHADLFAPVREDAAEVTACGEASTWYLYSEHAAERIHRFNPAMKIVAMLRNPVDRAYSNCLFNVAKGYDPILEFEAALAAEPERLTRVTPFHQHYVQAGFYAEQVRRYIDTFGREQVLVLLYDDFRRDGRVVTEEVFRFLGVDPTFGVEEGRHNATHFPRFRQAQRWLERSNPVKRAIKRWLPEPVHAAAGRLLRRANRTERPSLTAEQRERLARLCLDDVRALSELLGRDLISLWISSHSEREPA